MLHNIGFNDGRILSRLVDSWRNLYSLIEPDIVLFEHSPTAILASHGFSFRRVVLGSGFYSPPNVFPIRDLQYWASADQEVLEIEENELVERINHCIGIRGRDRREQLMKPAQQLDLIIGSIERF
jgi:hypothetical protein